MDKEPEVYSIVLHLRRVVYEDAFVSVPVTSRIVDTDEEGKGSINYDKFVAEALKLGNDSRVEWKTESAETEVHPLQMPVPKDRNTFRGIDA